MSIEDIRRAAAGGKLIVILGAGASMALTPRSNKALSWTALVQSGLDYGHIRGLINDEQHQRNASALGSSDIDDLLGVAEFVGRKLQAPQGDAYARWMRNVFEGWKPEPGGMQNALRAMDGQKIPIATLNYDTLAETCNGVPAIDFADTEALMGWARREREGVLHLHGVWTNPANCIFGIRDYHSAVTDETRLLVQRSLSSFNQLLFIGCGDTLTDPNFSSLIDWLRQHIGANAPQHYALVRSAEVRSKLSDARWRGFVEPISYGDDYSELPGFLLNCFPTRHSPRAQASKAKAVAGRNSLAIDAYRNFLLRDCGEMTIEGMRADMDTAQRKFDLEKLFVPLEVLPFPPIIPLGDPNREAKLQEWRIKNANPIEFSGAFGAAGKIALLALPGGGKTLLLKRLAVAYASSARREMGADNLPALDLLPVMIRCREWKEHIRKPIPVLLKSIATITGETNLDGLADALSKPLKAGNVLLLVDGLDEIHDDGDRAVFVENLEKFLEIYPKIRLLVTSREAGFDLVAPRLARFCAKFKIAPLSEPAITALCSHWHRLMSGGTADSTAEAEMVATTLIDSKSLRRLAENPLLLTMLLVVKHGAGRLPPDRVSLYERAVEVLLDTWNIKGHEALNVKEAVPQLACVAYELLCQGKQTATEREILTILEDARAKLPMVGRYAKDSPHDFLKRVELRSSLMVEGGHTSENGKAVPFYQFRHLTFQEYLAAVAAVDGYTLSDERRGSPLSALCEHLLSDEWKEVIPMAAVLARMQAVPLLDALVAEAELERNNYLALYSPDGDASNGESRLPPATSRLAQSLIEEAIFTPQMLAKALEIVALFANGCRTNDNWQALSRGPYGLDLRSTALDIFLTKPYARRVLARNTVALLEAHAEPLEFWTGDECEGTVLDRLTKCDTENLTRSLLSISGGFWLHRGKGALVHSQPIYQALEAALSDDRQPVRIAAAWGWGFWRHLQTEIGRVRPIPSNDTLVRLISWFFDENQSDLARFAINDLEGIGRGQCDMQLSAEHEKILRDFVRTTALNPDHKLTLARIAFILNGVFSDTEIADFVVRNNFSPFEVNRCQDIFEALGLSEPKVSRRRPRRSLAS